MESENPAMARYQGLIRQWRNPDNNREEIERTIWSEFGNHCPVSWVGFYFLGEGEMTLGPRRDKPACSPIGLHGACGRAAHPALFVGLAQSEQGGEVPH